MNDKAEKAAELLAWIQTLREKDIALSNDSLSIDSLGGLKWDTVPLTCRIRFARAIKITVRSRDRTMKGISNVILAKI